MWVAKVKIKHECVIGSRCEKFKVTTIGVPFNVFIENNTTYSPQVHSIHGNEEKVKEFIEDLKRDPRVTNIEHEGNIVFFVEVRKDIIPATYYHHRLLHVKPVYVDKNGYEYWEIASWEKNIITKFINSIRRHVDILQLLKLKKEKITQVYFPQLFPHLSENQKRAFILAVEYGYYDWPKKTNLKVLAKAMKVSVSTYREHLKRAEKKIIPYLVKLLD